MSKHSLYAEARSLPVPPDAAGSRRTSEATTRASALPGLNNAARQPPRPQPQLLARQIASYAGRNKSASPARRPRHPQLGRGQPSHGGRLIERPSRLAVAGPLQLDGRPRQRPAFMACIINTGCGGCDPLSRSPSRCRPEHRSRRQRWQRDQGDEAVCCKGIASLRTSRNIRTPWGNRCRSRTLPGGIGRE